ncbi:MAG: alpha/beta hydrolase [Alphaproteobacteria bacterium]|nr:alpha/beta hydrolase [Alphaproteobacteria bacterium]
MISRRAVLASGLSVIALAAAAAAPAGVVVLHGKTATPDVPPIRALAERLEAAGLRTLRPDMPWSRSRYLTGPALGAFDEIGAALARLKAAGATKLFLAGHSIGATAALGYAVARGGVDGLAMIATGHVPQAYYGGPGAANRAVHDSIDRARALVLAGKGEEVAPFADNNQGQALTMHMKSADYLGWFEPGGVMDPAAQIAKAPCPVLFAVGEKDGLFPVARTQYFDRLPKDPRHVFLALEGGHAETPRLAAPRVAEFFKALS